MSGAVVEFLTFTVDPHDHVGWVDADERVWTTFLRRQTGFVAKQVWIDRNDPSLVHTAITWTDEASWKSIPRSDLERTDAEMGEWRRPFVEQVFDVARSS